MKQTTFYIVGQILELIPKRMIGEEEWSPLMQIGELRGPIYLNPCLSALHQESRNVTGVSQDKHCLLCLMADLI